MTVTSHSCIHEEFKSRLNSGNAHYHSVLNLLSSCLSSQTVRSTGRTPHDNHNHNFLGYNDNLVMSSGGAQPQDLTDRPTVNCKVILILKIII